MRFFVVLGVGLGSAALALSQPTGILNYRPITAAGRVKWGVVQTVGPAILTADIALAAWDTRDKSPREYGTHWAGFGRRIVVPITIDAVSNTMEAGLGAIWGEDPRYFRAAGRPFKNRIGNVIKFTFLATDRNGHAELAYARYAAYTGSNFLANKWVPDSQSNSEQATFRIGLSFAARLTSNTFSEFWPDVKRAIFRTGP